MFKLPGILTVFVLALTSPCLLYGQGEVSFIATADARQLVKGSYVDVSFTLKNADGNNFTPPAFEGFRVISGPSRSVRTSIVNGRMSKEESYIYTLQARGTGQLTIGPASIRADGRNLRTRPLTIEVVKGRQGGRREEAFIRAELHTTEAWVGQQLLLDYKLYTTVDVESFNILEEADYQGFYAQDIRRYDGRIIREVINGAQYVTKILKRVALFPQQAGNLTIGPMNVQLGIVKEGQSRRNSYFFSPEVRRVPVETDAVTINVSPLPENPPPSFTGAVGNFSMLSSLNRSTATTDDALSLKLTISGTGDMKRVQAPELQAPEEFELYEPKVLEESTYENGEGITGKKIFEYLLLPKEAGTYQLQPAFSYFDPDSARYITVDEQVYTLNIRPGTQAGGATAPRIGPGESEEEDIRYIKLNPALHKKRRPFLGSGLFWLLIALPFAGLGGIMLYKRWISRRKDIDPALLRSRKAKKIAEQRLASARQHLQAGDSRSFYDEVSKAMMGYVYDKLHIPRSAVTKEELRERLRQLQLEQQAIERFMAIINNCEMALFAGKDHTEAMQETYQNALQVLSAIESRISGK